MVLRVTRQCSLYNSKQLRSFERSGWRAQNRSDSLYLLKVRAARLLDFDFVEEVIDETIHGEYGGRIPVGSNYIDFELQSPAMKLSYYST